MDFEELMNCHKDNPKVYKDLLARFTANRVVPCFGAGMSVWAGYPKWKELLLELCGDDTGLKKKVEEKLASNDYESAAELIEERKTTFRRMLANKFNETKVDGQKRPKYQELFPKLFRGVLLTTNFDQAIEKLYTDGSLVVVNPADEFKATCINRALQGEGGRPVLLKLHGDMNDPLHIVLTRKDYDDAYGADARHPDREKPMPQYLDRTLANNAVLFLGSSLQADRTVEMVKCFCANEGLTHFAVMALAKGGTARTDLHDWGIETIWFPSGKHDEAYSAFFNRLAADLGIGEVDDTAFLPVRDLVGRKKNIKEVCKFWKAEFKSGTPLVWVSGPGGIGKTEFCKAVCKQLAVAGDRAFVPMSDLTTLEGFYAKVLTTLGQNPNGLKTDDLAGVAARALTKCCKGGVAYFDNAEDLCGKLDQDGKAAWKNWLGGLRAAKVGVVVSSRESTLFAGETNCKEVVMKSLVEDAAKTLFDAVWGRKPHKSEITDYNCLIKQLEGYPLAIVLVALRTRAQGYLDRKDWEKAAEEFSHNGNRRHMSMKIALRTSWETIRREPQAVLLWALFHMSVVPLSVEILKGLMGEKSLHAGLEKLRSLGLVYNVDGERSFDMLNPIKQQFPALSGRGLWMVLIKWVRSVSPRFLKRFLPDTDVVKARKSWLAYLQGLLLHADQTGVPKEKRVDYAQECAAKRTVHGLLPQVWRLLDDLCIAGEVDMVAELMGLACNFFMYDVSSMVTLEKLCGFFQGKPERKKEFACASVCLGDVRRMRDAYDEAEQSYADALNICREIGDRLGEANALQGLGYVRRMRNAYDKAVQAYDGALKICREIGYRLGEANALQGLGDVRRMRDAYDEAEQAYDDALKIYKDIGDRLGEANALRGLGDVRMMRAAYDEAKQAYAGALKICREIGSRLGEANACLGLGNLCEAKGDRSAALESFQKALQIGEEIGYNFACEAAKEGIERLG